MLGTGAIVKRPMVVTDENGNESIGVRSMMLLAADLRSPSGRRRRRRPIPHHYQAALEEASFEADLGL